MFIMRSSESITIIVDGKPYTVASDQPQYQLLSEAIDKADELTARDIVTAASRVAEYFGQFGAVQVYGGHVTIHGEVVHNYLVERIVALEGKGIDSLSHFLNNVSRNPSRRAVQDLYRWCEAAKMPLSPDGCIIAYKIVNHDFTDSFTGKYDNSPGKIVSMPRNCVDDNPDKTCSFGLHFCSAGYLPYYGPANRKVILVKVNPADVVAFPTDYNLSKARCCRYEVLQEIPADTARDFFKGHEGLTWEAQSWVIMNEDTGQYWHDPSALWVDDGGTEFDSQDDVELPTGGYWVEV